MDDCDRRESRIRSFFADRKFVHVWPGVCQDETIVDAHIDPVDWMHHDRQRFLQSSPEYAMKRMLADGSGSIYSLGPVFRDHELGDWHRFEFTMLEWYEIDVDMIGGMATTEALSHRVFGDRPVDRISYREAFKDALNLDPIETDIDELRRNIRDANLAASLTSRDDLLDVLLSEQIQPKFTKPTLLFDYPITQAALAEPSPRDDRCASRFEWFVDGVELGNGYQELRDADELIRRTEVNNRRRVATGREPLPPPKRLIDAMRRGLPACSGVAVGLDRLHAVARGETRLPETT